MKNVVRTVKLSDQELEEFRRCYAARFAGAAPISDAALIRYLAIRGCAAINDDLKTEKRKVTENTLDSL